MADWALLMEALGIMHSDPFLFQASWRLFFLYPLAKLVMLVPNACTDRQRLGWSVPCVLGGSGGVGDEEESVCTVSTLRKGSVFIKDTEGRGFLRVAQVFLVWAPVMSGWITSSPPLAFWVIPPAVRDAEEVRASPFILTGAKRKQTEMPALLPKHGILPPGPKGCGSLGAPARFHWAWVHIFRIDTVVCTYVNARSQADLLQ